MGLPSRTGEGKTLGGLLGFAYATVSQDFTFFVQPKLRSSRARGNGLSFPGPPRLCTRRPPPRLLEDARAIRERAPGRNL